MTRKIKYPILFGILFWSVNTLAQNKMLTMEDAILKANTTLAPGNLQNLVWIPGSDSYSYTVKKDGTDYLVIGKVNKPGRDTVLSASYFHDMHKDMSARK